MKSDAPRLLSILVLTCAGCAESKPNPVHPPLDQVGATECKEGDSDCDTTPETDASKNKRESGDSTTKNETPDGDNKTDTNPPDTNTSETTSPPTDGDCDSGSICKAFTAGEREACKRFVSNKEVCDTNQWEKSFYENLVKDMTCTIAGSDVTFRGGASSGASQLGLFNQGDKVFKLADPEGSCAGSSKYVRVEGSVAGAKKIGYVCIQYIKCP